MPASSASTYARRGPAGRHLIAALLLPIAMTACTSTATHAPTSVTPAKPTQAAPEATPPATEPSSGSGQDAGGTDENSAPTHTPAPDAGTDDQIGHLIGLAEDDAEAHVRKRGLIWRVVSRDGQEYPVTMDYSPERVNATIIRGNVTHASIG